ncbi:hypothetical protein DYBT9275_05913 [Dyadobacter sp. CECT 9275]|uniref:Uncharacterized protein n=1 Tax=Dyadobacter helix TaxID=2822344 RepID=A0A916JKG5_9BACT|nr:hypothetical protein [Dyadobacter sp. CECT 9275]CAG5018067.1 hypothetical protein DYBT9275_05913 [Dyadobacter sp. CECT 9275]
MRSVLAYILLFAVMLPTLSPWGTVAYFNINRAYIARVLCENRDKPTLNCNGKCYLAKKLKEQQNKKDKETTERVENMPIAQLFFVASHGFTFPNQVFTVTCLLRFFYLLRVYTSPINDILQPPWW